MLDLALLRAEPGRAKAALARRGAWAEAVDAALDLDRRWGARREVRESLRARRRQISHEVARRTADGRADAEAETPDLVRAGRRAARDLKAVRRAMRDLSARREAALLALPNLPGTDVPDAPPALDPSGPPWPHAFPPLAHWDLVAMLGLVEPAGGAGSGFLLWRGAGARLVRGLVRLMLDVHTGERGREEILAPPLATREALTASAHLPTLEEKMYKVLEPDAPGATGGSSASAPRDAPPFEPAAEAAGQERSARDAATADEDDRPLPRPARTADGTARTADGPARTAGAGEADLFLAPRAEPHLATLYADAVLDAGRLPMRFVAAATALRRAPHGGGIAGRGLLRLGAFPTVEVYALCRPEESDAELERALADAETILARLGVAHRRRVRAATELSHAAARTVSLDVWCPGLPAEEDENERGGSPHPPRGRWVEVAALSSFTDYQARRTGTRFRDAEGRARLVHTVGGAAVAVPRLLAALLETGQQADGAVRLPAALAPYVGGSVLGAR